MIFATGSITALNANLATGVETPGSTVTLMGNSAFNQLTFNVQGGTYTSTLIVQETNDTLDSIKSGTANWTTVPNSNYTKVSSGATGAIAGNGQFTCPVSGAYSRVTCSAYVGTDSVAVELQNSVAASAVGPVTSNIVIPSGAVTDASGTITTGGTAQTAVASNTNRKYILIENPTSATEVLYFSFTGAATTSSLSLAAGGSYESDTYVPTGALSVLGATTGHAFNVVSA